MKILAWIVQILLALAFMASGFMKLITPYGELMAGEGMAWVGDFSAMQIKIIALLEILAVVGLIVPMFLKKFRVAVPLAALGLALIMVGAMVTHIGRGEPIYANIFLLVLAVLTAWLRRSFFKTSA